MSDEITSILEQVALHHHTTVSDVRREIGQAIAQSAVPELTCEECIAFAALTAVLSFPAAD